MKFTFNAWPKRIEIKGVPVCKTKWRIEAPDLKTAIEIADRICKRLTHGNTKDCIKHDTPEKDAE